MRWAGVVGTLIVALDVLSIGAGYGQSGPNCPVPIGRFLETSCTPNVVPADLPPGMGGRWMTRTSCGDSLAYAIASLFSYNDPYCHSVNTMLNNGSHELKLLQELPDYFTAYLTRVSAENNFHATLYCGPSNHLMLAFRGSVELTSFSDLSDPIVRDDWIYTNFLQHLGSRPLQYELAETAADLIERAWSHGAYDGRCGVGRPAFLLTGHSKGGGQAQFAAVRLKLAAVVFNSDMVNPVVFDDWMQTGRAGTLAQRAQSILCRGELDQSLRPFVAYFGSGRVRDVRMVNDPVTRILFGLCGHNLPHAPIEWLANTSMCSNDGHGMRTVIRELDNCEKF
jgi:hypothetical protein